MKKRTYKDTVVCDCCKQEPSFGKCEICKCDICNKCSSTFTLHLEEMTYNKQRDNPKYREPGMWPYRNNMPWWNTRRFVDSDLRHICKECAKIIRNKVREIPKNIEFNTAVIRLGD